MSPASLSSKPWKGQLARWFEAYRADEPVAGSFRARQLQAVLRLTATR